MGPRLETVCGASLPRSALPALAGLRRDSEITVALVDDRAWVRWPAGSDAVLCLLLPIPGVELFDRREGSWYRPGDHLPAFGLPWDRDLDEISLARAIVPPRISAASPGPGLPLPAPMRLGLVRDDRLRPTSALRCACDALGPWAETAPTAEITSIQAARSGGEVLLLGRDLPAIVGAVRFWGDLVFRPIGFRAEPDLPEASLRDALGVGGHELLILEAEGAEIIPQGAFRRLSRASLRLVVEEGVS